MFWQIVIWRRKRRTPNETYIPNKQQNALKLSDIFYITLVRHSFHIYHLVGFKLLLLNRRNLHSNEMFFLLL